MKFSHLKGIAVVDLQDARKLGDLEDIMLESNTRQVMELKVKTGLFGSHIFIPISWMNKVGKDAITVTYDNSSQAQADGSTSQGLAGKPETTSGAGSTDALKLPGLTQILDNQVVTDSGTLLGQIKDVLLNEADLSIEGYEVSMGGLFSKTQKFAATTDIRYGGKLVTVPEVLFSPPGK